MSHSPVLRALTLSLLLAGALSQSCFSPAKNRWYSDGELWFGQTYCHVSMCVRGEVLSGVHQEGVPWTGPGCMRYVCSKTGVTRRRCPPFVAPPNCITVVDDPHGDFPHCCPRPQCF